MKSALAVFAWLAVAAAMAVPMQAQAGRSCEQAKPMPEVIVKGMQLAERTSQALDASGARVVILSLIHI